MSAPVATAGPLPRVATTSKVPTASRIKHGLTSKVGSAVAIIIAIMWITPTVGLFVSSFRPARDIRTSGWWTVLWDPVFTLSNYQAVLVPTGSGAFVSRSFVNSLVISIPGTLFPLILATMAAYSFSVLEWRGRDTVFVTVFALQIVPLQMALIPLLRIFTGTPAMRSVVEALPYLPVWIAHTAFALPLATFLLHNFMAEIPRSLIEAARVDGAGHVALFFRIMLPVLVPALASFAIFQFLWVWNDLLVGLTFAGGEQWPLTAALSDKASANWGQNQHLLTAGAFVSMVVPLVVFFSLQKYFVRGLLAGSVKG